jgi:hypothetical protein
MLKTIDQSQKKVLMLLQQLSQLCQICRNRTDEFGSFPISSHTHIFFCL